MKIVNDFSDYRVLDMANGEKLEKWGKFVLRRPDPQIIWDKKDKEEIWERADAIYHRSNKGGGSWELKNKYFPKFWQIKYLELTFNLRLMNFKHTGIFPEQAINWQLIDKKIREQKREIKVLNLFAYTGAASLVALAAGAIVTHVDSSKGMIAWAKENLKSSNLEDKPIRFFVDDCKKFVKREIRRGSKYDVIIMDPPSFGRGASGEVWDIEKDLYSLVKDTSQLLSENAFLFLINSYTTSLSKVVLENILHLTVGEPLKGDITSYELGISVQNSELVLPCGVSAKWEKK